MNICETNSNNDRPHRSRDCLCAALAALALLVCTASVAADCPCDINVPQGTVLTIVDDLSTNCMKVDGLLNIVGATLTLTGDGCATSKIDGTVVLKPSPSRRFGSLAFTTNDHLLQGNGAIDGRSNFCQIKLGKDVQLESRITIEGALQITEPIFGAANTTFVNNGNVKANFASRTFELNVDSLSSPTGDWEVSASSAVLWFRTGSHSLSGDFTVSAGTLKIDESVDTAGSLTFTGGTIDVAPGKSFKAGGSGP